MTTTEAFRGAVYDPVANNWVRLPAGWRMIDERSGLVIGPNGERIEVTGPTGRWHCYGKYYKHLLNAIKESQQ